jgi:hypothetical protein
MDGQKYELKITGTGECRDADGNLLDAEGNPITTEKDEQK